MAEKVSHKEARYTFESRFRWKYCGNCSMFRNRPEDKCTLVVDPIHYDGYCIYWEARWKDARD